MSADLAAVDPFARSDGKHVGCAPYRNLPDDQEFTVFRTFGHHDAFSRLETAPVIREACDIHLDTMPALRCLVDKVGRPR